MDVIFSTTAKEIDLFAVKNCQDYKEVTRVQVRFQDVEMRYDDKQNNILYEALIELGDEVAPVAKLHGVTTGK